jgi:hypothetical protein
MASALNSQLQPQALRERGLFKSVPEYIAARVGLDWLSSDVRSLKEFLGTNIPDQAASIWRGLSEPGKDLLAASIMLAKRMEVGDDQLIDALRPFAFVQPLRG